MVNIHFFILSSFCLILSSIRKSWAESIVVVSKLKKYQSPFIDDFGLNSSDFSQMELTRFQEAIRTKI